MSHLCSSTLPNQYSCIFVCLCKYVKYHICQLCIFGFFPHLLWPCSGSEAGQDGPNIDHFDFGLITPGLIHLEELHLTYG